MWRWRKGENGSIYEGHRICSLYILQEFLTLCPTCVNVTALTLTAILGTIYGAFNKFFVNLPQSFHCFRKRCIDDKEKDNKPIHHALFVIYINHYERSKTRYNKAVPTPPGNRTGVVAANGSTVPAFFPAVEDDDRIQR